MSIQGSGNYASPWSSQTGLAELEGTMGELEPLNELTEVGFEPQTRQRSNTWPLPRPDNYVDPGDDGSGSKKNSNQNLAGNYLIVDASLDDNMILHAINRSTHIPSSNAILFLMQNIVTRYKHVAYKQTTLGHTHPPTINFMNSNPACLLTECDKQVTRNTSGKF